MPLPDDASVTEVAKVFRVRDDRLTPAAQKLTRGVEPPEITGAGERSGPSELIGGATNLWTGILTGIGAFLATFGSAVLFLTILVFIGVVIVTALRRRN